MRRIFTFSAILTLASWSVAAEPAKLKTLAGPEVEGELVRIDAGVIVQRGKDGEVSTPFKNVVRFSARPAVLYNQPHWEVELNDGSVLRCTKLSVETKQLVVELPSKQELKIPIEQVNYAFRDAHVEANRNSWQSKSLKLAGTNDMLLIMRMKNGELHSQHWIGTLVSADQAKAKIEFDWRSESVLDNKVEYVRKSFTAADVYGVKLSRLTKPADGDPLCKIQDTMLATLVAKSIAETKEGYLVTTMGDLKIAIKKDELANLDFQANNFAYLSDLELVGKPEERSNLGGIDTFRRDKNLDNGQIRIGGQKFEKGMSMHAYSKIAFAVGGKYDWFKATVGMDDQVGGDGAVRIRFLDQKTEKELHPAIEINRKDKKGPLNIAVNIKGLDQFTIIVESVNLLDLGAHVCFGDARVTK